MFINEIIWRYSPSQAKSIAHDKDFILYYSFNSIYNIQRKPYIRKGGTFQSDKKLYGEEYAIRKYNLGQAITSTWTDIPSNKTTRKGMVGYPTQKPYKLLERIINLSTV